MEKDTVRILEEWVRTHQEKLLEEDWEWRAMKERQTALETAFRARHRGNRSLILEVNDLLDALCLQLEREAEYRLLWGLQMGLELGSVDGLRLCAPEI